MAIRSLKNVIISVVDPDLSWIHIQKLPRSRSVFGRAEHATMRPCFQGTTLFVIAILLCLL